MWWLLLFLTIVFAADPTVDVQLFGNGVSATVRGIEHPYGRSFRGIPYAKPPVGFYRFIPAQQRDPYSLIDATNYKSVCKQQGRVSSEDCLFLNVFTPKNINVTTARLPVFVWIHGGGFIEGSGNLGGGMYQNMINRGPIIVVSLNYRLGPFGFLTTRTYNAPGNLGITDCIEALHWVRRYIQYFGGDPNQVTIGGQSSGAEAVSFLSLTTKAVGLYKAVVLESGSAFGAAVMSYSDQTRNTSQNLAINIGCTTSQEWQAGREFHDILQCLQSKSADAILNVDNKLRNHRMKWAPVPDTTLFPERLETLAMLRKGVPVLIGDVHDEWIGWDQWQISHNLNGTLFTRDGVADFLRSSYEMTYWDNAKAVYDAAAAYYIYSNNAAPDNHVQWAATHVKLFGEMVFIGPVLRDAKYFASTGSPVYLYSFDYLAPAALPDEVIPALRGVPHAWELQYLFNDGHTWVATQDDITTTELMGKLWTNFIRTGNPTPSTGGIPTPFQWPKLAAKGTTNQFVSLGPRPLVANGYHPTSMFWACNAPTIDGYKPAFC